MPESKLVRWSERLHQRTRFALHDVMLVGNKLPAMRRMDIDDDNLAFTAESGHLDRMDNMEENVDWAADCLAKYLREMGSKLRTTCIQYESEPDAKIIHTRGMGLHVSSYLKLTDKHYILRFATHAEVIA